MGTSLEGIKAVFLDLDGTIYLGGKLIDGALEFLDRCDEPVSYTHLTLPTT